MSRSSVRNFYDRYWNESHGTYSGSLQGYTPFLQAWMRETIQNCNPRPESLELGCGDASFTRDLATFSASVTAVDVSEAQIELNRSRHPEIDFRVHDLGQPLPFEDESFDLIWCSEVLEHLFDPGFALNEAARVLRQGGRIMITVPFHGRLKNLLVVLFRWNRYFDPEGPHIRFFSIEALTRLVKARGLVVARVTTCGAGCWFQDLFFPSNILLVAGKPRV